MKMSFNSFLYVLLLNFFLSQLNTFAQLNFDTLEVNKVGPGIIHYKIKETTLPQNINVLVADLKNPFVSIETVKSFDRVAGGRERTSSMAERNNSPGHWVVGAVNGDFFDLASGATTNIQMSKGELIRKERPDYPAIGFNSLKNVFLGRPYFSGKVIFNNSSLTINGVNEARAENTLISYNHFTGPSTSTNDFGTELLLRPVNTWITNDTVYAVVDSVAVSDGNMQIPNGMMVLSAHGTSAQTLNGNISKGDTIKVLINVLPGLPKMNEMIGGHPVMVTNGSVANMDPNDGLVFNRHPRTAVGINQDTSKIYLIVVDGRQPGLSVGMTLFELAEYMISLGVHNAMNLDGGGSSAMVVRNEIESAPSDPGGERTVANSLMIISNAPLGNINEVQISPELCKIFIGGSQQFSVSGYDEYYNSIALSPSAVQYSLSKSSMGFIGSGGLLIAGITADTGYVFINYGSLKDSALLIVKGIDRIELLPKNVITDNSQIINFTAKIFDTEQIEQNVSQTKISWSVTDTLVGKIDPVGQFQGKSEGITKVIASYMGKSDTAVVDVQIGRGVVILDSMDSIMNWNMTGENIDTSLSILSYSSDNSTSGSGSLRIDYSFTYETGKFNWVYLNSIHDIFGIPDSILIDVLSDGANHRIFFDLTDANGFSHRVNTNKIANKAGVFETIKGRLLNPSAGNYPLKLSRIAIPLGSTSVNGQNYSGTIFLDNLRVRYKNDVTNVGDNFINILNYKLYQNFPNPFNPITNFRFVIPSALEGTFVSLKISDILGNEIETLVSKELPAGEYQIKYDGSNLSSGIYFYTLIAGEFIQTKKFLLLK